MNIGYRDENQQNTVKKKKILYKYQYFSLFFASELFELVLPCLSASLLFLAMIVLGISGKASQALNNLYSAIWFRTEVWAIVKWA